MIAAAAAIALLPLPSATVERYYADWLYPTVQSTLTSWSNETAFALFDFLLIVAIGLLVIAWWRWLARSIQSRSIWPAVSGLRISAVAVAGGFFWFQLAWGFNYARVPLETAIGYNASRVTRDAVLQLAERAVAAANRTYAVAHQAGFPELWEMPPALVSALHDVERKLGRSSPTVPGRPKRTLLAPFFRASGVDGMHAPFLLETLLNPDLTPPERPAVLAHEWAHLAGYAPEDDASFIGLVAALRAGPAAQYSAWLTLVFDTTSELSGPERRRVLAQLAEGPRKDRQAIFDRLQSRVEVVHRASWETYDRYLKAQGVEEGLQSYARVVQLLIGSGALDW